MAATCSCGRTWTAPSIARISERDAQGFVEFGLRLRRFGELMRPFQLCATPPSRSAVMAAFEASGEAQLFNELMLGSTRSLLDRYLTSDHTRGFLNFYGLVSIWAGPDTPEGAYLHGYHAAGEFERTTGRRALVKGGMGGIIRAVR